MRRLTAAAVAVLVLVATLAAVPAAGYVQDSVTDGPAARSNGSAATETANGNETANGSANASVAPGERFSGVIGVQKAEISGEVASRSFGLAVARAASDEARAQLIAEQVNETRRDVAELRERRAELRQARDDGSIGRGEYRARIAELAARSRSAERLADRTANASADVPDALLEAEGVDEAAIQRLRANASDLTGPEVAAIARDIAGTDRADRGRDRADGAGEDRRGGDATPEQGDGADGQADPDASDRSGSDGGDATTDDASDTTTTSDGDAGAGSGSGAGGRTGGEAPGDAGGGN